MPTDVDYTGVSVGGIVGDLHSNTYLSNCINIGTVKGRWRVGGIAGGFSCDGVGVISDCMNAG